MEFYASKSTIMCMLRMKRLVTKLCHQEGLGCCGESYMCKVRKRVDPLNKREIFCSERKFQKRLQRKERVYKHWGPTGTQQGQSLCHVSQIIILHDLSIGFRLFHAFIGWYVREEDVECGAAVVLGVCINSFFSIPRTCREVRTIFLGFVLFLLFRFSFLKFNWALTTTDHRFKGPGAARLEYASLTFRLSHIT